jgi:hypothetical protein
MVDIVPMVPVTAGIKDTISNALAGTGTAVFACPVSVAAADGTPIGPKTISATITAGAFASAVKLYATDTVGSSPLNWMWHVIVATDEWTTAFRFALPFNAGVSVSLGQLWKTSPDNPANQ